jgi:zinc transporter ZupT
MNGHLAASLVISGALAAGYAVAALFFFSFWRDTRDRLFGFFAGAFVLLALQRIVLAWASVNQRNTTASYSMRLAAFLLILIAILDKNRAASRPEARPSSDGAAAN